MVERHLAFALLEVVVRILSRSLVGLIICALALAAQNAQSPFAIANFSATVMTTTPSGQQMRQKMYKLGDKLRLDMTQRPGMFMLMLLDQQQSYMVMGPQRCMEMSTRAPRGRRNPFTAQGKVERKALGTETVDGHVCKVEEITVIPAEGQPTVMKAWEAQDLNGFPIRVEIQTERGPMQVHFTDISLNAPDAAMMAVPQGCRAMPSMPGMPH